MLVGVGGWGRECWLGKGGLVVGAGGVVLVGVGVWGRGCCVSWDSSLLRSDSSHSS